MNAEKLNAEQRLNYVRKLDELINAKIAEQDRLKAIATDITAKPMDGMPFDNTGTVSRRMENAVINLIMITREIDKLIDQYIDYKRDILTLLEKLPEREYGVLHRYYIQYMTIEQVAEVMGYCTVQIWRIKKKGLKILQDVIECNVQK